MSDDKKHITPGWAAVAVSIISLVFVAVSYVRAGDVQTIHENTKRIDSLQGQVAALIQGEEDLVNTINHYIRIQAR